MNQNEKYETSKLLAHQRRTQSIDEYSIQLFNQQYEINKKQVNGTSDDSNHEKVTKKINNNDEDYVCAPIPRTNNRPSAKTCWRSRSVYAPSPLCNFGPKGTLKKVKNNEQLIVIQDPSSQRLHWISSPLHILIIRKPGPSTLSEFRTLVIKLLKRHLYVYVELADHEHLPFSDNNELKELGERCVLFNHEHDLGKIDLIICLGGDGTLLHASSIFQSSCPPVLSFSMGSLGFLTPFDFKFHEKILHEVLSGNVAVLLRTRLHCKIKSETVNVLPSTNAPHLSLRPNDKIISNNDDGSIYQALNEVVIDRGPNSYLSNLDLFINDKFITKVQGDGLIISSPTGSTAYAMAAGASMVHPNVPAMVICPVCPHSLSFRPIVIPAGIELTVKVSQDTRITAWLSIDGRNRLELKQEDSIRITTSVHPVPCICRFDQVGDWFESLADILHWNLRKSQLNLDTDQDVQNEEESQTQHEQDVFDEKQNLSIVPTAEPSTHVSF